MIEFHERGTHTVVDMDQGGRFRTIAVGADPATDRIVLKFTADMDGRTVECVWRMTPEQAAWLTQRLAEGGTVTPDEANWLT